MANKRPWTPEEDLFLKENFHMTTESLAKHLKVSELSVKKRYQDLEIERPTGKNNLTRARNQIFREKQRDNVPSEWFELPSTRTDAKEANSSFYWDGQPCERSNHISKRKTSSGGCWDCDYGDHKAKLALDPNFREKRLEKKIARY